VFHDDKVIKYWNGFDFIKYFIDRIFWIFIAVFLSFRKKLIRHNPPEAESGPSAFAKLFAVSWYNLN